MLCEVFYADTWTGAQTQRRRLLSTVRGIKKSIPAGATLARCRHPAVVTAPKVAEHDVQCGGQLCWPSERKLSNVESAVLCAAQGNSTRDESALPDWDIWQLVAAHCSNKPAALKQEAAAGTACVGRLRKAAKESTARAAPLSVVVFSRVAKAHRPVSRSRDPTSRQSS